MECGFGETVAECEFGETVVRPMSPIVSPPVITYQHHRSLVVIANKLTIFGRGVFVEINFFTRLECLLYLGAGLLGGVTCTYSWGLEWSKFLVRLWLLCGGEAMVTLWGSVIDGEP